MKSIFVTLSRLLDYFWFWSILYFTLDVFDLNIFCFLAITLFVTILFIPIETILVKLFQTTLGKFIFGYRYTTLFTWKSAFLHACKKAIFLTTCAEIKYVKVKPFAHVLAIAIALFISALSISPDSTINQASKVLPFKFLQELKAKKNGGGSCPDGWIKLEESFELPFVAFFPEKPNLEETKKEIPHSTHVLVYREYSHKHYSLGYVDLPKSWVKWGSNLVFKGAMQQVINHGKGSIVQKVKTVHEQFPALDYEINRGKNKVFGRLILVNTTIYNLEATSEEGTKELADQFFNAFHLQI